MTAGLLAFTLVAAPPTATLSLPDFDVVYTSRASAAARLVVPVLEDERRALASRMGEDYPGRTTVVVAQGPEELAAVAPEGSRPPPWAAGAAVPEHNVVLLEATALLRDEGRRVVRHELAHLALARGGGRWPRWFQEGFAMAHAGEWSLSQYAAMYRATAAGGAIPLRYLHGAWPEDAAEREVAYAESIAFVQHLFTEGGANALHALIRRVRSGESFDAAFAAAYGMSLDAAEYRWRLAARRRYTWVPLLAGTSTLWTGIALLVLVAYRRVRRRRRERMLSLEAQEKATEAAQRIARAEAAATTEAAEDALPGEHRGRWLH